jgi:release factor glutamine methyltransferase
LTLAEALAASGLEPREARLLLAAALGAGQASIVASPERDLPQHAGARYFSFAARRRAGEPVAYILGTREFYGLELAVTPAVLIPRPETELLVELALARPFDCLADLGTGSGALALAIKRERPSARVVAVESSEEALAVARANAARHGLEVDFRLGRWFTPLRGERYQLIVSNPPYVAQGDPHLAQLRFEPAHALVSGPDGLDDIRDIVARAEAHLAPGGELLLEHGQGQDREARRLMEAAGLREVMTFPDLAGIGRVTGGKR